MIARLNALMSKSGDWIAPIAAVMIVFVMLVPMPSFLLDLFLTVSITASVLVLLTAINVLRPTQFSVFPSLILMLTLLRLALDLAATRRILLHGNEGTSAAGKVVESFGQFVVGGNFVVGFVIFIALVAIQFLVISHGAVRTAEVTARFTLDAMPGKQMAIDADLNAGLINEAQAKARRERVAQEAEFCGSMDGAARFSQRDSMATILILAINIIAGICIGVFQQGVPIEEALKTYTILTVGDGLVSILPSLLVSVAGGIVVTRAASKQSLGVNVGKQLFNNPKLLWIAGGVLIALGLVPGLPKISFFALAAALIYGARKIKETEEVDEDAALATPKPGSPAAAGKAGGPAVDPIDAILKLDELMLEVGTGLVPMVDAAKGGQLLNRVKSMRKNLAQQLGFLVPSIHITDNLSLKEREYVVYLRGVEIARWELRKDSLLAISSNPNAAPLPGQPTREPAFNVAAVWISPQTQGQAIAAGYTVVDPTSVLSAHLAEVIKQNAHELLSRHETKRLIDRLTDSHPKLSEELIPKLMSLGEVQKVLQQLLREQVSVRDLGTILETLVEAAAFNKNPIALVEAVRHSLGRALVHPLLGKDGELKVVTLDAAIEEECNRGSNQTSAALAVPQHVALARRVLDGLTKSFGQDVSTAPPVLLCSSPGRFYLRRLLEPFIPRVVVLSPGEIPPMTQVQSVANLR
ncbi:flagellar biosynthesis protein FlhA [Bryocella elongata]|uniref:Flagellar biosynthesis protein FlhA n=1 Tax=Bryocella elongata TaxID=863522 RepID=A0A1H5TL45_9BACT|nr:flagellar biosynthesis protein FlhA [Bryocella elongata]SEF62938.1 flagellar biosynthesis protein FlhA [Bryocella elongata]